MNKREYIAELTQRLNSLPLSQNDVTDALRFYEEYFDEAGPDREQDVITELGSPAYVAAQIALKLSESPTPLTEKKKTIRRDASVLKMVVLGVLASPVALPLAAAVVMVIIALAVSAAAVVFAFSVSGIACAIIGAAVTVSAAMQMPADFATGMYFVGTGLLAFGIGGFLTRFGLWLGRVFVKLATRIGSRFFNKSRIPAARTYAAASPVEHKKTGMEN